MLMEELISNWGEHIKELSSIDVIDKNLIKYFSELTYEEKKKYILKTLCNNKDRNIVLQLEKLILTNPFKYINLYLTILNARAAYMMKSEFILNKNKYSEIISIYEKLLKQMSILAKELNLNNSLELSNLYSYLLWNGYLSKNKRNEYCSKNRKFINGLHFADIMDGIGVCLNHSDMLKDFLNICGYNSAMLNSYCSNYEVVEYSLKYKIVGLDDNIVLTNQITNETKNLLEKKRISNHVFNLIEDNGKLYIYDSTDVVPHIIVNQQYSELLVGKGISKLFPYESYMHNASEKEDELIDRLLTTKDYTSPYSKDEFICISNKNIDIIRRNLQLIEDFYIEAKPNILHISEETDKIKRKLIK